MAKAHKLKGATEADLAEFEVFRDLEYGKGGGHGLYLDLVRPKKLPKDPMPVIVLIHGGGWKIGDKDDISILPFVEHGYLAVTINYRLTGEAPFPAQVEDCKCAVRWLRAHAEKYHLDPSRIGTMGQSAGGHLSQFLGTTFHLPQFEGKGGWEKMSSAVNVVVSCYGVSDLIQDKKQLDPTKEDPLTPFLGGSLEEKRDVYITASPITHVSKKTAPMLLIHGELDEVVPINQSEIMRDALTKIGVKNQFIGVKNANHGLFAVDPNKPTEPAPQILLQKMLDWFDQYLKKP